MFKWILSKLAKEIVLQQKLYEAEEQWLKDHKTSVSRMRAIVAVEYPEKVNNYKYIQQRVVQDQGFWPTPITIHNDIKQLLQ